MHIVHLLRNDVHFSTFLYWPPDRDPIVQAQIPKVVYYESLNLRERSCRYIWNLSPQLALALHYILKQKFANKRSESLDSQH